jgi:hypothetical protein
MRGLLEILQGQIDGYHEERAATPANYLTRREEMDVAVLPCCGCFD